MKKEMVTVKENGKWGNWGGIWVGRILWRKEESTRFDTQHRRSKKRAPVPVWKQLGNTIIWVQLVKDLMYFMTTGSKITVTSTGDEDHGCGGGWGVWVNDEGEGGGGGKENKKKGMGGGGKRSWTHRAECRKPARQERKKKADGQASGQRRERKRAEEAKAKAKAKVKKDKELRDWGMKVGEGGMIHLEGEKGEARPEWERPIRTTASDYDITYQLTIPLPTYLQLRLFRCVCRICKVGG